jgi:hypothetical protein
MEKKIPVNIQYTKPSFVFPLSLQEAGPAHHDGREDQ